MCAWRTLRPYSCATQGRRAASCRTADGGHNVNTAGAPADTHARTPAGMQGHTALALPSSCMHGGMRACRMHACMHHHCMRLRAPCLMHHPLWQQAGYRRRGFKDAQHMLRRHAQPHERARAPQTAIARPRTVQGGATIRPKATVEDKGTARKARIEPPLQHLGGGDAQRSGPLQPPLRQAKPLPHNPTLPHPTTAPSTQVGLQRREPSNRWVSSWRRRSCGPREHGGERRERLCSRAAWPLLLLLLLGVGAPARRGEHCARAPVHAGGRVRTSGGSARRTIGGLLLEVVVLVPRGQGRHG